jgi:non-canonical purine NTP pyrophosphatase (RdgB/HAM1 family)
MKQLFLVTGNTNKLAEWHRLLPTDISIDSIDLDLAEIQSIDPEEIVADKARRAFAATGKPVVVEDVSAGLDMLGGLPGPFIKFFLKKMGEEALFKLAGHEGDKAAVSCSIAYYDGQKLVTVTGVVDGSVAPPRGVNGFGFDKTFIPNGETKTYAEMSSEEKDKVSHRARAIALLVEALKA